MNYKIGDKIICIKNTDNNVANIRKGMTGIVKHTSIYVNVWNRNYPDRLCIEIDEIKNISNLCCTAHKKK